eukprot:763334-Hanusia_phi.AAC.2
MNKHEYEFSRTSVILTIWPFLTASIASITDCFPKHHVSFEEAPLLCVLAMVVGSRRGRGVERGSPRERRKFEDESERRRTRREDKLDKFGRRRRVDEEDGR